MESQPDKQIPKIVFNNEPKLSKHEVDKDFNERRVNLLPHVKNFIANHERFKDKEVSITIPHRGISSLVSIIETPEEKLVLKIPLGKNFSQGEGQFLKVWEEAGVKVPHVIEEGTISEHSYLLMEYIDAKPLAETHSSEELLEKEIFVAIGRTMRVMHSPEAKGFGRSIDKKAEFPEFKDWLTSPNMQKRIQYVEENKLLGEEHGSLSKAFEALLAHVGTDSKSSYCHDDFGASNIFDTKPLTVFDPNPRFNNGYMDLGRSIAINIAQGGNTETATQLIKGYFDGEPYNEKALHASILFNTYMKFPYWHQTKQSRRMKNLQEYLIQTKYLLD